MLHKTSDYALDENGVFDLREPDTGSTTVICTSCRAGHQYDLIHQAGDKATIALAVNRDPIPYSSLAFSVRDGQIENIMSPDLLGLIVIDENKHEVASLLTVPSEDDDAGLTRAKTLAKLIPKGEWKADFPEDA